MGERWNYDLCKAEDRINAAINALRQFLQETIGKGQTDKNSYLIDMVTESIRHSAFDFTQYARREIARHDFDRDFYFYILHKCKSLKEAREYLAKSVKAFSSDTELRETVDFDEWKKRIDKELEERR